MPLGPFLRERRAEILALWESDARVAASTLGRERPALVDDMPQLIDGFAQILEGDDRSLDTIARNCAAEAVEHGYPLSQVVRELGLFRRCVLRCWRREDPGGLHADAARAASDLDRVIERTVDIYLEMRTSLLAAFEAVAASALSAAELDGFLRELLRILASVAPTVGSLAILMRDGERLVVRASTGTPREASLGTSVGIAEGFAGAVASSAQPMTWRRGTAAEAPEGAALLGAGTRTIFGVPLLDGNGIVGVVLAAAATTDDLPVAEARFLAVVAARATATIVKHQFRSAAVRRAAELDAFIEAIPSPVYVGTAERFLNANRAGLDAIGVASKEELERLAAADVIARVELRDLSSGAPVPLERSPFMRALRGERVVGEFLARKPQTGEDRCLHAVAGPVVVDGRTSGAVIVTTDVTETKLAEERFRIIFERVPMAMAQSDPQTGKIVRANAKLCELIGYDLDEIIGHSFMEWTHPDDRSTNLEQYGRLARGELGLYTIDKRYVRKDGTERWVHVTASLLPSPGEAPRTLATIEDITERKRSDTEREELLARERAAAERLRTLAGITHAFAEARLDFDRLLAVIPQELTKEVADACVLYLVSDDGRFLELVTCHHADPVAEVVLRSALERATPMGEGPSGRAAATGETVVVGDLPPEELRKFTPPRFHEMNERFGTLGLVCAPLRVSGRVLGTLTVARHAATRRRRDPFTPEDRILVEELADRAALAIDSARLLVREQAAREEAERAREELQGTAEFRERLIGIVSHDLRTPLSAITLGATFLARAEDLPAALAKPVARVGSAADRMRRIIEELLDFTRGRLGGGVPIEPRPTDLGEIVRRVLDELELSHPSRELALERSGQLEGIWDETRLAQVVSNLVGNALEHSPTNTPVTVALADRGESGVALDVKNQGTPIPPALLPHLFDPFHRGSAARSSGGLGLGLFIAAEIVRAHGGTIRVTSTLEEGTTFGVLLPRASTPRPP
jgi:PAS domain S-box-containing protein